MADRVTDEDRELLGELGVEITPEDKGGRTPREQRIIAGFEEIERFYDEHGRAPQHGEGGDIFERLYAVRLDRIRESAECREVLKNLDQRGLLGAALQSEAADAESGQSDEELLASLGVDSGNELTRLVHVRSREEINAAEEIARRAPCPDFHEFQPLFETVQQELSSGVRSTAPFAKNGDIIEGDLFIHGGQKALVAEMGEQLSEYERANRKLRVIYDNGTENAYLLRSFQRALYKTPGSRRILKNDSLPLFADVEDDDDSRTGYVYVLRSKSEHPFVAEHRTVLHKIGVTGGDVRTRVANARKAPTYLLADVEIAATYKLANVNRKKLEALLHRFFGSARMDLELKDRFGSQVEPQEWFLVPLGAIDEAIRRIKDGSISGYKYDPSSATLARD